MPDAAPTSVRLDKWLWAARVYKTRSDAAQACRAGHVTIGGHRVKPARDVRANEVIVAKVGLVTRTLKVVGLTERRVGPKVVGTLLEEQAREVAPSAEQSRSPISWRPRGLGRPTKKDRRSMGRMLEPND